MRLAVLSDIHGNLAALEAVHRELKAASPDLIVNLGDCVSGPLWPEETAQYLLAEQWLTVRGNHDRMVIETPADRLEAFDLFTRQSLSQTSLSWLAGLPINRGVGDGVLLCHGGPTDDEVFLLEEDGGDHFYPSGEDSILRKIGRLDAGLVLCGHTHTPRLVRLSGGQMILNPGSVGVQAFPGLTLTGSPHARFAIATHRDGNWSFGQHMIDYDWNAASARARSNGEPGWAYSLATGYGGKAS
ncbi:metallophosphoesterase family protein [Mesorhizobium sp. LHD-90]|uniref:metallophosphoesterase family protein n=1 Tax=Mesorhizobium sp. LHD-90 TaxID=3071414 RepID=UPI0027DFC57B|nr:metallophosphoesterase family protein [Mesorhizobium sp. LHD-90]MDQ6437231.1 metallophosphoesterase family protein [Mesorhizobium sp. LHD-90]